MKTQYETQLGIAATTIFTASIILAMFGASNKSIYEDKKSDPPVSSYISNTSSTNHTDFSLVEEIPHPILKK